MGLFGTSGIRDLSPQKVNARMASHAANIVSLGQNKFAIAYDSRKTGQMLKAAALSGASSAGAHCFDLGICPTPTLAYFSQIHQCPAIMITASHNPYEYNGLKFFSNGHEISFRAEKDIEEKLSKPSSFQTVCWDSCAQISHSQVQAFDLHTKLICDFVDTDSIKSARPKVIVDCANMAGSILSPIVLQKCGCDVVKMNCNAGTPSPRPLEPNSHSLEKLCEAVVTKGADFAVAHDGDADRAVLVDERGELLGLDSQLAIVSNYILEKNKGAKIISTVESSLSLRQIIDFAGGELEITPVGSMKVSAKMRELKSVFGGEPCGEYIFGGASLAADGLLSAAFFAEIFAKKSNLSSLASKIANYPIKRCKISCPDSLKQEAMKKIIKNWPFKNKNLEDGVRSDLDWGWVLVRPSGTEPYIRITIEAKNNQSLEHNYQLIHNLVQDSL